MSEEIKKQETMDDFAQEIEASFNNFRDADMEIWDKLEQMKEDKEAFEVTIEGIVKGGAIAYVEGIRAFTDVVGQSRQFPVGFRSECRREFTAQFSRSRQVLGDRLILFAAIRIFPDMCVILQIHHPFMDISLSK